MKTTKTMVLCCGDYKAEACKDCKDAKPVEVCVKTGYYCAKCDKWSDKAGPCGKDCAFEAKEVVSEVVYKCAHADCPNESDTAGDCCGAKMVKSCTKSGTAPHTGA